jgi:hypothetical protein
MNIIKKNLVLMIFFLLLFFSYILKRSFIIPKLILSKDQTAINLDSNLLSIFSIGQKRLLSSLLWISTLLESDMSHYKEKNKNSWMFLRFKTISDIDPLFLKNYQFGGQYLNIVKDDIIGSEYIFDKGLSLYSKNYELNFNAAFLHAYELKNFKKAKRYYLRIKDHPNAPKYLPSLIEKLEFSETGDLKTTLLILSQMYQRTPEGTLKFKLESDIYSIQTMIDLECLNSKNNKKCNSKNPRGEKYIKKGNIFVAPSSYKIYELNFRPNTQI